MKLNKYLLMLLALVFSGSAVAQKAGEGGAKPSLPAASEIIAKYVTAIGGREANAKFKSRVTTGKAALSPLGISGTFEQAAVSPNRSALRMELAGVGQFLDVTDGGTSWANDPIQGFRQRAGKELDQQKNTALFARTYDLNAAYTSFEVKGIEKVGGSDAYVVIAKQTGLPDDTIYFDVASGLIVRTDSISISPQGEIKTQSFPSDYREVDGIKIPFKIRSVIPNVEIHLTVEKVEHDVTVSDEKFARPK